MTKMLEKRPILDVQELRKQFVLHMNGGSTIEPLDGISFRVVPGTVFLISGKSGAGKTSILKCIYRTYLTTAGAILYESQVLGRVDLATADEATIRALREQEIGYCSQFLRVLPRVSALDIAAEPMLRRGVAEDEARARAAGWLARLDVAESRWQAYPVTFSGGEQQRLNVIRALIAAPRLLLLDEPTASLDTYSKSIVLDMIADAKRAGVTIVVVSHDSQAFEGLADDGYMMDGSNVDGNLPQNDDQEGTDDANAAA